MGEREGGGTVDKGITNESSKQNMLRVKFNLISTTGELHFVFCFRGCHQTGLCYFANSVLGTMKLYSDACEFFA